MNKEIKLIELGLLDYKKAWDFQEKLFQEIIEIKKINRKKSTNLKTPNYLVFVEHPNVFTMGKNGDLSNLLVSEQKIREKNAFFRVAKNTLARRAIKETNFEKLDKFFVFFLNLILIYF